MYNIHLPIPESQDQSAEWGDWYPCDIKSIVMWIQVIVDILWILSLQNVGCTDWGKHVRQYQWLSKKILLWDRYQNDVGYDDDGGDGDDGGGDDDDDGGADDGGGDDDDDDHRASLTSVCALFLYSEIFSGLMESPLNNNYNFDIILK